MKKIFFLFYFIAFIVSVSAFDKNSNNTVFTKSDILRLSPLYLQNNMHVQNAAFVDVDNDGDFDILVFKDGNVIYYKNIGNLEEPEFKLENDHYDKYSGSTFIQDGFSMPVFFADMDGDGDLDLFAVKSNGINPETKKNEYRVLAAKNYLDLDTGTLITIILVLVIVVLVLAIVKW